MKACFDLITRFADAIGATPHSVAGGPVAGVHRAGENFTHWIRSGISSHAAPRSAKTWKPGWGRNRRASPQAA